MKKITEMKEDIFTFYENMNEIVYITDMDTYDIVYMNRKTRELYGLKSPDEYRGKKCYTFFQGSASPCAICTNSRLKSGSFKEWKYFNPKFGKTFLLKDTMLEHDGRRYRLEIAVDATFSEEQQRTIDNYVNNEKMINETLRLALSTTDTDKSINTLIEYVGNALKSERMYIFEQNGCGRFDNTYEWCADDVVPQKENLQNIPYADLSMWMECFLDKQDIIIKNLDDIIDTDPVSYSYLYPQDIDSLVASPLIYNGKVIGFYGVDNPPQETFKSITTLFQILGHFIVSLLRRRDLQKHMEYLSFYDELTGLGNRYLMDDYVAEMNPNDSIGIAYCDVTGLKKVNDTEGHKAGDALLLRACECLKAAFSDDALFRVGGDEFLVISSGTSTESLNEKVASLKAIMKDASVLIAVGSVWSPTCDVNIDKLIAKADEYMYEDKKTHYNARK